MTRRDMLLTIVLSATYVVLAVPAFSGLSNPDLTAAWAAAMAWQDGAGVAVYGASDGAFDTLAPASLTAAFDQLDYSDHRYAYIYAPLWLAVLGPLTEWMTLEAFLTGATWVNVLSVLGMCGLAWRMSDRKLPLPAFVLIGLAVQLGTWVTGLALYQNQVQIFVALLVLAAADRTAARAPIAAGIALALAAALKSYPVLLVVIWIGLRDWRAIAAFAISGGALALASVALTGWEMHVAFLGQLAQVAGSVLLSPVTLSLPGLAANLGLLEGLSPIAPVPGGPATLQVGLQPSWLRAVSVVGLIAVLAAAQRRPQDPVVWAVAACGISLCTAVSWSYHYMTALAVLPVVIDRLGWVRGGGVTLAVAAILSFPLIPFWRALLPVPEPLQLAGTVAVVMMLIALAVSLRRDPA